MDDINAPRIQAKIADQVLLGVLRGGDHLRSSSDPAIVQPEERSVPTLGTVYQRLGEAAGQVEIPDQVVHGKDERLGDAEPKAPEVVIRQVDSALDPPQGQPETEPLGDCAAAAATPPGHVKHLAAALVNVGEQDRHVEMLCQPRAVQVHRSVASGHHERD